MTEALRILLIDDNAIDRALITEALTQEFPRAEIREVAAEAQLSAALQGDPVDVVLTDYLLPWTDGLSIARDVKARWPECPVLLVTGSATEETAVGALQAGVDDYILKTVKHLARLPAAVRGARERAADRQARRDTEARLRGFIDQSLDGIILMDATARIVEWNRGQERITGRPQVTVLGRSYWDVLFEVVAPDHPLPASREVYLASMAEFARTGRAFWLDQAWVHVVARPDGSQRVVQSVMFPIRTTTGFLAASITRDITEQQEVAEELATRTQQLEALRAVGMELTRELDLSRLLGRVVQEAARLIGAASGAVWLWNPVADHLEPGAFIGHDPAWFAAVRLRLGEGVTGTVAQRRAGLIVMDVHNSPLCAPAFRDRPTPDAVMAEPLVYQDRLLGTISLDRPASDPPFTARDQEALRLFADQAALALANANLYRVAVRRSAELEALLHANQAIHAALDLPTRLQAIVEQAAAIAGAQAARILLLDPDAQVLRGNVGVGLSSEAEREYVIPVGESFSGHVAATGEPLVVADTRDDPRLRWRDHVTRHGLVSYVGLPVQFQGRLLGVLVLNTTAPRTYAPEEVAFLSLFASQAAIAIQNARSYEDEQRRRQELEAVQAASEDLARELDLAALLQLIHGRALGLVQGDTGVVYLWDDAGQVLVPTSWQGVGPWVADLRLAPGDGVAGTVAARREGQIVNDFRTSPYATPIWLERSPHVAVLAEPLLYRERLVGVIAVGRNDTARPFRADDQRLLRLFATPAAIAIENARLVTQLTRSAEALQHARDELVRAETLRTLGQMAAGVAHDLNNMLATVLGQAELLRLRVPDPVVQESLQMLELAATDGAHVVRRLQDFARQRTTVPLAPVDLAAVVREALEITRPRWQDEPLREGRVIETHIDLVDLPSILGHAAEVREALTNLIGNAVDAMPLGGRLAFVGTPATDGVLLAVSDTGRGMAEDVRRRIFEPFFTTKGSKGTGLGLSVVYAIMERHQGSIQVQSAPGRGTTFTLRFQAAPKDQPAPPVAQAGTSALAPQRLLLIDDEATVRGTIAALLRASGHTVTEADGGATGLALLADMPIDVVLTDLGMPDLTGWDVAREVKARTPRLPVILLTGWGEQANLESRHHEGLVDRVVGKPFRLEELLRTIAEVRGAG